MLILYDFEKPVIFISVHEITGVTVSFGPVKCSVFELSAEKTISILTYLQRIDLFPFLVYEEEYLPRHGEDSDRIR